jgi:Sulfotransferase family
LLICCIGGVMGPATRLYRPYLSAMEETLRRVTVGIRDPRAQAFYARLIAHGYEPNRHIDVLPDHRLIYVCVPKCASSRIKMTLSTLIGRSPQSPWEAHNRKRSGLKGPKHVGLSTFWRIAVDPSALRFSFVRNPYDRIVSCWADKFRDKPLIPGQPSIDPYLAWRQKNDGSLPHGADRTLSFSEFVSFATATAGDRIDAHWQLQVDLADMPGIALDVVGKIESFENDFGRVLDHVGADEAVRRRAVLPFNVSYRRAYPDYYTPELAARVYRAYERDFDRFGYARALMN